MTTVQTFRSSTASILFTLAEKHLSTDLAPPPQLTTRAACIYARLAKISIDIDERPNLNLSKDLIQTNLVITKTRPLTTPTRQVLETHEHQLRKLEPEIEAYRQSGLNLEKKQENVTATINSQLLAFCTDVLSARSMSAMLASQPIQSGLTSLEENVQRLQNELDIIKRTGVALREKLEVILKTTQALEQGTRTVNTMTTMGEQRPRLQE